MVGTATLWADSVVDWLHENGLFLTRGGQPLVGANREIATLCGNLKTEQLELIKVVKAGVCSVGDLVSADHKEACWWNPTLVGAPWLSGVLPALQVLPSTLRRGQLWKISAKSGGLGGVVEILGGSMSMLQVKIWAVTGKSINLARGAVLSLNSTVLGAGADTNIPFDDIFCGGPKSTEDAPGADTEGPSRGPAAYSYSRVPNLWGRLGC